MANGCFGEHDYVSEFEIGARGIEANCPHRRDYVGWLFLMQHHGCPTRLLDWSESILVALYFAVTDQNETSGDSCDGELWCLNPGKLNQKAMGWSELAIAIHNKAVRRFAKDAAKGNVDNKRHVAIEKLAKAPIAVAPSIWFRRGVNQLSQFTIHPRPGEGATIEETLGFPSLLRYIIPKECKRGLADSLYDLGIRPETMFPDLDGLSRGIHVRRDRLTRIACDPQPPECGGTWTA